MALNQFIMKIHFVTNLMVFIWYYKYLYFLFIIGQTYDILKHNTVPILYSFGDGGGSIYALPRVRKSPCLERKVHGPKSLGSIKLL